MFRILFPALPFLIAVVVPAIAALVPEASRPHGLAIFGAAQVSAPTDPASR